MLPIDENAESDSNPEGVPDPGATKSVTITVREHATIVAALRYVARHGGFRPMMEADIAANGGQWDMIGPGDRFKVDSDPVPSVRL